MINGDISDDVRALEQALAACAIQVETVKQCQDNYDAKAKESESGAF